MKSLILLLSGSCMLLLVLDACTSAQIQSGLTSAESAAWTAANAIETVNTDTGGILTTALVNYALKSTHNTGDAAVVQAAAAEANKVIAAQIAARTNGTSNAGLQAIATAQLSDPGIIESSAATIQNSSSIKENKSDSIAFLDPHKFITLRCPHGESRNPFDVRMAKE